MVKKTQIFGKSLLIGVKITEYYPGQPIMSGFGETISVISMGQASNLPHRLNFYFPNRHKCVSYKSSV
jgi:hypothetical protein